MDNFRIEDAINLQNERQRLKNEKDGKPKNHKILTKANLGRMLFPNLKGNAPLVRMSTLLKESKLIRPEWVDLICEECGVDADFLFNQPSSFDKEFNKLVTNKTEQ